jgi:hypothetical protein
MVNAECRMPSAENLEWENVENGRMQKETAQALAFGIQHDLPRRQ